MSINDLGIFLTTCSPLCARLLMTAHHKASVISNCFVEHNNEFTVPLACSRIADSHHGSVADKPAALVWCYCVSNNKIAEECFQERFVFVPRRIKTDQKGPNSNKVSREHSCLSFLGQLFGHFKLSVLLWTNFFVFAKLLIYSSLFIINHWFNFSSVAGCYNIQFLEWASGEWS